MSRCFPKTASKHLLASMLPHILQWAKLHSLRTYQWIQAAVEAADKKQDTDCEQPDSWYRPPPTTPGKDFSKELVLLLLQSSMEPERCDGDNDPNYEKCRRGDG